MTITELAEKSANIQYLYQVTPEVYYTAEHMYVFDHWNVAIAAATADVNINDAITLIEAAGYMANGIAMSPTMRGAIGAMTTANGWKYPDFNFGAVPANLGNMTLDVNPTVAVIATGGKADHAIIGDFECFRWGIAKEIPLKVIEYGDPDGQGDLQRKNEIVLRAEAYIGWAIMDANAFARVQVA